MLSLDILTASLGINQSNRQRTNLGEESNEISASMC